MANLDEKTVKDFGSEWERFDHSSANDKELRKIFDDYFCLFPWSSLPKEAVGFDLGCGTGRWARFVAAQVGRLHCIDPSSAIEVARKHLDGVQNIEFHSAGVDNIPLERESMDFGYSLGVLHHVPDTQKGIDSCVSRLKPGAPFLLYLYYALDNKPAWFRGVWKISNAARILISKLPAGPKAKLTDLIAGGVYWPLARSSRLLERAGFEIVNVPLSSYRDRSFYVMRTDALDRFGTRLETRFRKVDIMEMMARAGLERIVVAQGPPYWCALGYRSK